MSYVRNFSQLGDLGSGAGRGGGGGGSIRTAGGAFGKLEAGREEEYFHRKQMELVQKLKDKDIKEQDFLKEKIKEHKAALERHEQALKELDPK